MNTQVKCKDIPNASGTFVIFSDSESVMHDEPMFWSNTYGWGDLGTASRYSEAERLRASLPVSVGKDATWLHYEEAIVKIRDVFVPGNEGPLVTLRLSPLQASALCMAISGFIQSQHAEKPTSLGDFAKCIAPVREALRAGSREIRLDLLTYAVVIEVLAEGRINGIDGELGPEVYGQAAAELLRQLRARADVWRESALNVYAHDFKSRCPTNGATICYRIVISTTKMILVEDIVALARQYPESYHEPLAEAFYNAFGGMQRLTAFHHGVHIKTIRTDSNVR